jgi:D-inositol-3-phosphate glycosyltransferase
VPGHSSDAWAAALHRAVVRRSDLARGAVAHAGQFSWAATGDGLLETYRDALADRRAAALPLASAR